MARTPSLAQAILTQLKGFPNLDPRAVLAIASHEGLGGGIGDNGTSFGPFQLHYGGAYPSNVAPTGSPQASQAWAWSPQGINYALGQINQVAGGLTGYNAISNISRRFERPANPAAEIADAASKYNTILGAPSAPLRQPIVSPSAGGGAAGKPVAVSPVTGAPAPSGGLTAAPKGPTPQQLAQGKFATIGNSLSNQLSIAAQQLMNGGVPNNLGTLFALAKGYQEARAGLNTGKPTAPKAAPMGGTTLGKNAGLKSVGTSLPNMGNPVGRLRPTANGAAQMSDARSGNLKA